MKVTVLHEENYKKILSMAERILKLGGIVAAPTDTVYGLLGDATRAEVVKKMFAMKKRPEEKAFPIFVKVIASARKYAYISDAKAKFLEKVWPGSLTVIFQHKEKLPKILTGGLDTIGIRIPNHRFLLELLARIEFPLAQTSANISGRPPARSRSEIKTYFGKEKERPDLIIDGGEIAGRSSAVIDFTGKEPLVLRTGAVSKTELDRILNIMK